MFEKLFQKIAMVGECYTKSSRWIMGELSTIAEEVERSPLTDDERKALMNKIRGYILDVC